MKILVVFALLVFAVSAKAYPRNSTERSTEEPNSPTTSDVAFSPFFIYNDIYALGTFAKVNWYQAQILCASYGYTLASIDSEFDQQRIRNFIYTNGYRQWHLLNQTLWTSGTNLAGLDNNWIWFSNGHSFTYRNFENDQSNLYPFPGESVDLGGNCLGMNGISNLWTKENCSSLNYFICQRQCAKNGFYFV